MVGRAGWVTLKKRVPGRGGGKKGCGEGATEEAAVEGGAALPGALPWVAGVTEATGPLPLDYPQQPLHSCMLAPHAGRTGRGVELHTRLAYPHMPRPIAGMPRPSLRGSLFLTDAPPLVPPPRCKRASRETAKLDPCAGTKGNTNCRSYC